MKKQIAIALLGLMGSVAANAAVPADLHVVPGSLFVNWQAQAASSVKPGDRIEVRGFNGDVIASAQADASGRQVISLPRNTQGNLTVTVGDESSDLQVPYTLGQGRQG